MLEDKLKLETRGEMKPVSLDPASTKAVMADLTSMKENVMKTDNMLLEAQRAENALLNAETGTFAKGKFAAKKLGKLFGIKGFEDDISATEALSQVLGGNVLAILSSGDLGAGTGLSDKDVEFARQVAAGTIELTEENIRYAIDVKRRAANYFRSRYSNSVNNYVSAFEDAGKVPVFVSTQQNDLGRYKTVDFKPISKEGQLLFGSEPGTLMQMRETTGVLSPANAAAIGNNVGATPEPVQLNPKFEGVSTADLIGDFSNVSRKIERMQEIANRGAQDQLPPEKLEIFNEAIARGVISMPDATGFEQEAAVGAPVQVGQPTDSLSQQIQAAASAPNDDDLRKAILNRKFSPSEIELWKRDNLSAPKAGKMDDRRAINLMRVDLIEELQDPSVTEQVVSGLGQGARSLGQESLKIGASVGDTFGLVEPETRQQLSEDINLQRKTFDESKVGQMPITKGAKFVGKSYQQW